MSLEKKDVRFKLDPSAHEVLRLLSEIDQLDIGEWCAQVVMAEAGKRLHVASVIKEKMDRLGILGKTGELPGIQSLGPKPQALRR